MPQRLTPFTVLALLKQMHEGQSFSPNQKEELSQSITQLERHYFAMNGNGSVPTDPDLRAVAENWLQRT